MARLNGLKWLATHGEVLPAGVERILVMDATDLKELPLTNDDPNLPKGLDVEAFWSAKNRKPTRVLLRHGSNAQARAAAEAAARAAAAAADAAKAALEAIESGDAEKAAEAAIKWQQSASEATEYIQRELQSAQALKRKFQKKGVIVETLDGGEPLDVMKHLGVRNGLHSVVWRAGCWGERGVNAILPWADDSGNSCWLRMPSKLPADPSARSRYLRIKKTLAWNTGTFQSGGEQVTCLYDISAFVTHFACRSYYFLQ
jgi:hypothetical protein